MQKLAHSNALEKNSDSVPLENADAVDMEEIVLEEFECREETFFDKEAAHPENFVWHPGRKF